MFVNALMGRQDKYAAKDLQKLATTAGNLLAHPVKTGEAAVGMAVSAVGGTIKDFETGNLYNMGEDSFNIASMFAGAGEAKAGGAIAFGAAKVGTRTAIKVSAEDGLRAGARLGLKTGKDFAKVEVVIRKIRRSDFAVAKSKASIGDLTSFLYVSGRDARIDVITPLKETKEWPTQFRVPRTSDVLLKDGSIDWDVVPKGGYVLNELGNPIKHIISPKVGDIYDRDGSEYGVFFSPVINGKSSDFNQRSTPYVEDPRQKHRYIVKKDFSTLKDVIDNADPETKHEVQIYLKKAEITEEDLITEQGEIAPGFGLPGGGIQTKMPLPAYILKDLGVIAEVK